AGHGLAVTHQTRHGRQVGGRCRAADQRGRNARNIARAEANEEQRRQTEKDGKWNEHGNPPAASLGLLVACARFRLFLGCGYDRSFPAPVRSERRVMPRASSSERVRRWRRWSTKTHAIIAATIRMATA